MSTVLQMILFSEMLLLPWKGRRQWRRQSWPTFHKHVFDDADLLAVHMCPSSLGSARDGHLKPASELKTGGCTSAHYELAVIPLAQLALERGERDVQPLEDGRWLAQARLI